MKDRAAKEWSPWMELGGGNANHDKRADQFIYDMDEKLKVETRHLVTLSVLTNFMSSERSSLWGYRMIVDERRDLTLSSYFSRY